MSWQAYLPYLAVMVYPSGIDSGTARAYLSVEHLGELEELVESFS